MKGKIVQATSAARRIVAFLDQPTRQEGNVHNKDDDDHDDNNGVTKVPLTLNGAAFRVGGITHENDDGNNNDKGTTGGLKVSESTYCYLVGRS